MNNVDKMKEMIEATENAIELIRKGNEGDLRSRDLSEATTCIETGLLWLKKFLSEVEK